MLSPQAAKEKDLLGNALPLVANTILTKDDIGIIPVPTLGRPETAFYSAFPFPRINNKKGGQVSLTAFA